MDEIVKAALRKWPNVPACYGWLALDARGDWYMRDERVQAAGAFPHPKGSRIQHDKLLAFIARNYACDGSGAWYFQNGPQRVYVELEAAPWVWRVLPQLGFAVQSHTGMPAGQLLDLWLCEQGRLFIQTVLGTGIVHTLDMDAALQAMDSGGWRLPDGNSASADTLATRHFAGLPSACGYRLKPGP